MYTIPITMDIRTQHIFFIVLLVCTGVLSFLVFQPYLFSLIFGLILAIAVEPLYSQLHRIVSYRGLASFLTILIVTIVIIIPLTLFGIKVVEEAQSVYESLSQSSGDIPLLEYIDLKISGFFGIEAFDLSREIQTIIKQGLGSFVQQIGSIFGSIFNGVVNFFIIIFSLFFSLKEKDVLKELVKKISPLDDVYDIALIKKVKDAINSVVRGTLAIAIIQGVVAGIGFSIFGIPTPVIWGAFAAVAAIFPTIGTTLVTAPAIAFLAFTGHIPEAIGMTIWAVAAVGLIDNLLAPFLIDRGLKLHPFIVLLALLGGVLAFGPLGFILGPVIVASLFALIHTYQQFNTDHIKKSRNTYKTDSQ